MKGTLLTLVPQTCQFPQLLNDAQADPTLGLGEYLVQHIHNTISHYMRLAATSEINASGLESPVLREAKYPKVICGIFSIQIHWLS